MVQLNISGGILIWHPPLLASPGGGLSLAELALPVFLEELVVFPKQDRTVAHPRGSSAIDF